jgi:hypothetical protein
MKRRKNKILSPMPHSAVEQRVTVHLDPDMMGVI